MKIWQIRNQINCFLYLPCFSSPSSNSTYLSFVCLVWVESRQLSISVKSSLEEASNQWMCLHCRTQNVLPLGCRQFKDGPHPTAWLLWYVLNNPVQTWKTLQTRLFNPRTCMFTLWVMKYWIESCPTLMWKTFRLQRLCTFASLSRDALDIVQQKRSNVIFTLSLT